MPRIGRATLVALAVAGLASAGPGVAFADGHGATASGGTSPAGRFFQQNTAQESKQNNTCANLDATAIDVAGGRSESRCASHDSSVNKRVLAKGGGAHTAGGSSGADLLQQNTAQEGRQNNDCAHSNGSVFDVEGSRVESHCGTYDSSGNHHTLTEGSGAHATGGGSAAGIVAAQQNAAQEGGQNNTCDHLDGNGINASGSSAESRCTTHDRSLNHRTLTRSGGAHTAGGGAAGFVTQQNTAQEGRQNNACANLNSSNIDAEGGRVESHCAGTDRSRNHHTLTKSNGAHTTGGSASAELFQQNTSQEGRQNNACANPNSSVIGVDGGRVESHCTHHDRSRSVGSAEVSDGADVEGGSSTASLFQQSTAQEGRQNNACGNPNNATVSAFGARSRAHCQTVDTSKTIASVHR
ncbi:hypothetical protein [Streptomyces sp. NPDC051776]|uniref:hypothetical protein n=1 Tax=Streptomyces sp. NPDC051776 TaxID=3155414 RepID=UPI00341AAD0E